MHNYQHPYITHNYCRYMHNYQHPYITHNYCRYMHNYQHPYITHNYCGYMDNYHHPYITHNYHRYMDNCASSCIMALGQIKLILRIAALRASCKIIPHRPFFFINFPASFNFIYCKFLNDCDFDTQ